MTFARRALARDTGLALGLALVIGSALEVPMPAIVPALAPAPVAAASPGLTITSAATYNVLPDEGRVAVTVQLTATNHLKNTITRKYSFRTAFLTVQPGTSGFTLTGGSGTPNVALHQITDTFTSLKLDFGANLAAGKTTKLTLAFDIRDAGGDPARAVRISPSLVTFGAWAFATPSTPGSTVDVQIPTGYRVTIGRGPLTGPEPDGAGHDQWTSAVLEAPLDFVADVVADKSVDFSETPLDVPLATGSASVVVRGWPDDPAWADRVANLVQHALPILEREIGVPWPVNGPLDVNEALVRGSGGFAGVFDPAERRIDVSYAAADAVVIHELAHAWFNGRLVADRWAAEAFASYYGELTTRELGLEIRPPDPVEPGVGAIPLNAWGPSGEDPATDAYAYAASLQLARDIAARAGAEKLQAVWALAARGIGAYRPDASTGEPAAGAPDWRGLLDLLEEQTGEDFGDLWRTWVARPEDLIALDSRSAARAAYAQTREVAADWRLPISIRDALRAWRFDAARDLLGQANAVLKERARLADAAAAAGVALPGSLRSAFEGSDGLSAAVAEAVAELSAVEMIAAATSAQPTGADLPEGLVVGLGLLGQDPVFELGAARLALQGGNVTGAYDAAKAARDAWRFAADAGRWRMVSLVLLGASLVIFLGLVPGSRRRRPVEPA